MLAIFRKRGRWMAALMVFSCLAGLVYYVSAQPVYYSKARVRIGARAAATAMEGNTRQTDAVALQRELNAGPLIERTARRLGRKGSARELQLRNVLHQAIRPLSADHLEIECWSASAELARRWPAALVGEFQSYQRETSARDFQQIVGAYREALAEIEAKLGRKVEVNDPQELRRVLAEMEQFETGPTELARISQRLDRFGRVRIELENPSRDTAAKLALLNSLNGLAENSAAVSGPKKEVGSSQQTDELSAPYQQARHRFELEYQALIKQKADLEIFRAPENPGEAAGPRLAPQSRRPFRTVAVELQNKIARFEEEAKRALQLTFEGTLETRAQRATPDLGRLLFFSLLGGAILALGLPLILACFDRSLASPQDVESVLGLPVLGSVPQMERLADGRGPASDELESFRPVAECLRAFRSKDLGALVVLVSSALRGEGKTLAAANLARSLADLGWRMVVVDCDFSRSRIHRRFGYRQAPGLAEVLRGTRTFAEVCRVTADRALCVVPAGGAMDHGTERLGGEAFNTLIKQLREEFDGVVLDTPPVLGFSEASILQKHVDGVVLVIRSRSTPRANLKAAVEMLRVNGAHFFGAVLNGADEIAGLPKSGRRKLVSSQGN